MHRKESVDKQILNGIIASATKVVPPNATEVITISASTTWESFVRKYIVPEVKAATLGYYGANTDSVDFTSLPSATRLEVKYPGFDYNNASHRRILKRHSVHRRLFAIFDDMALTQHEIYELCTWYGTLYARTCYERDRNIKIRDTTNDGICTPEAWLMEMQARRTLVRRLFPGATSSTQLATAENGDETEPMEMVQPAETYGLDPISDEDDDKDDEDEEGEEGDDELQHPPYSPLATGQAHSSYSETLSMTSEPTQMRISSPPYPVNIPAPVVTGNAQAQSSSFRAMLEFAEQSRAAQRSAGVR